MGRGHKKLIYGRELPKNEGGGTWTDYRFKGEGEGLGKKEGGNVFEGLRVVVGERGDTPMRTMNLQ